MADEEPETTKEEIKKTKIIVAIGSLGVFNSKDAGTTWNQSEKITETTNN